MRKFFQNAAAVAALSGVAVIAQPAGAFTFSPAFEAAVNNRLSDDFSAVVFPITNANQSFFNFSVTKEEFGVVTGVLNWDGVNFADPTLGSIIEVLDATGQEVSFINAIEEDLFSSETIALFQNFGRLEEVFDVSSDLASFLPGAEDFVTVAAELELFSLGNSTPVVVTPPVPEKPESVPEPATGLAVLAVGGLIFGLNRSNA